MEQGRHRGVPRERRQGRRDVRGRADRDRSYEGAKSGLERLNPLVALIDGDRIYVIASKGGAPDNPDWYYNLKANPRVTVELDDETFDATAVEVDDEAERSRLYDLQITRFPSFGEYKKLTTRRIPVIELVREQWRRAASRARAASVTSECPVRPRPPR